MPLGQSSSQLSGSTQLSSKDAFLSKAEAKSISQINAISEVMLLFIFTVYLGGLRLQLG